jgi:hypothetical protein
MEDGQNQQPLDDTATRVADFAAASSLEIHRHDSLWEEEKHYTWWVYVLIGFLTVVITAKDLEEPIKSSVVFLISSFGVFVSLLGFIVVRKEGSDLNLAKESRNQAGSAISIPSVLVTEPANHQLMGLRLRRVIDSSDKDDVSIVAKLFTRELGIRDSFQLLLFVSAVGFALVSGYTLPELLNWASRLLDVEHQARMISALVAFALVLVIFQVYSLPKKGRDHGAA